ncbi:uncharacterized protein LOC142356274 [Convolutriloba macropyga]|uniref:uncharacterized protein LOC142356274 n=1 Tax=Convolutriloba macropyga TaxID=536237 RepID=UPI003F522AE7
MISKLGTSPVSEWLQRFPAIGNSAYTRPGRGVHSPYGPTYMHADYREPLPVLIVPQPRRPCTRLYTRQSIANYQRTPPEDTSEPVFWTGSPVYTVATRAIRPGKPNGRHTDPQPSYATTRMLRRPASAHTTTAAAVPASAATPAPGPGRISPSRPALSHPATTGMRQAPNPRLQLAGPCAAYRLPGPGSWFDTPAQTHRNKPLLNAVSSPKASKQGSLGFKGVHHVAIIVSDLARSMEFYCGVLGLSVNEERPHDKLPYAGAWLWIGPEMIHLMELPNPDPLEGRPAHGGRDRHFCVGVESVEAITGKLDGAGIEYTASKSGRPAIFFRDPDMNTVECVEVEPWRPGV